MIVNNVRRHPYIGFIKSSSDDYKVGIEMSSCISYHHYYRLVYKFSVVFILIYHSAWKEIVMNWHMHVEGSSVWECVEQI